jgi:glyoxylase-like metal-dependent hydrolase (beta-lactamase superfamily II)
MSHPIVIDCDYLFPQYAASFLLLEGARAAFVENNTTHAVPRLLSALERAGRKPEDVEYVVITHVHLDHAGGTSSLMAACPRATLMAHPRAARHIKDPAKLIAGARAVYGDAQFEKLYGTIEPVAESRIREVADEEVIRWGSREWRFLHTRGHAKHHFCLWDSALQGTFTGDAFGVFYPRLQSGEPFIFPSTSPTDFEAEQARASIRRIAECAGDRALLTHYGELRRLRARALDLIDWIDFSESLVEKARDSAEPDAALAAYCQAAIDARFRSALEKRGLMRADNWELLRIDRELNAAGLAHLAKTQRTAES